MSYPTQNNQIVAQGLARLTGAFVDQPNIRALLAAYLQPMQDLEDAIWQVLNFRRLATATLYSPPQNNPVLDEIGDIVGQPRLGLSDADYQALIYLRIAVNRATGQILDWSNFAAILLGHAQGPAIYVGGGASFYFGIWDIQLGSSQGPNIIAQTLAQAVPNGVRGLFHYTSWAPGNDFEWGSRQDSTAGQGTWGSRQTTTVGGVWVAAAPI